jgi:mitotic spindle assembly checkpoint protein MAD1
MLRLRQVFAAKTAEFHEALSAILGVKVAFYDNGQVRVTSQYDLGAALQVEARAGDGWGRGVMRLRRVVESTKEGLFFDGRALFIPSHATAFLYSDLVL